MNEIQKAGWLSFRDTASNFSGNQKCHDYATIVANIPRREILKVIEVRKGLGIHYIDPLKIKENVR